MVTAGALPDADGRVSLSLHAGANVDADARVPAADPDRLLIVEVEPGASPAPTAPATTRTRSPSTRSTC